MLRNENNTSQDECNKISPNHKQLTRLCASLRKQNSNIMECQRMKMQQIQFPISNSNSNFQFKCQFPITNFNFQFPMPISNSNFQCYNFQFNSNFPKEPAPPSLIPVARAYQPVMSRLPWFTHGQEVRSDFFLRWQAIVRIAVDLIISHVQQCGQARKATVGALKEIAMNAQPKISCRPSTMACS